MFSTVEIFAGRVIPHGYYKMIHRESWYADSAFYIRMVGFAVFFTLLRLAVARWVVKVRSAISSRFFACVLQIVHRDRTNSSDSIKSLLMASLLASH